MGQNKEIQWKAFWDAQARQGQAAQGQVPNEEHEIRLFRPAIKDGLRWVIDGKAVEAEMKRQDVDKVDFKFCLNWHAEEFKNDGGLLSGLKDAGDPRFSAD